jgi:hypothetical protein
MTEAADLSGAIYLGSLLFKATNQEHLVIDINQSLAIRIRHPAFLGLFDFLSFPGHWRGRHLGRVLIHYASRARILGAYAGGLRRAFSHFLVRLCHRLLSTIEPPSNAVFHLKVMIFVVFRTVGGIIREYCNEAQK